MAFAPIAFVIPEYDRNLYKNWWLKAYEPGTTTPKAMATDQTGSSTASRYELNTEGFPITAGNALVVPHIDGDYDLWLFPTAAEADANDTTNALQFADNLGIVSLIQSVSSTSSEIVSSADTVADLITKDLETGQTISTKGYYVEGDGGGASYLIQTAAEFGGAPDEFGDHTLANGNVAALQVSGSVNVKQYGATGDGVTNDYSALQAALTARNDLYFPEGVYKTLSTLTKVGALSMYGLGVIDGSDNPGVILDLTGAEYIEDMTTDGAALIRKGDESFEVSGIGSLQPGDKLVVYNPTDSSFGGARPSVKAGEIATVFSASGTTVTIDGLFYDDYMAGTYNLAILKRSIISIKDLKFVGNNSSNGQGIVIRKAQVFLENVEAIELTTATNISLDGCYDSEVTNVISRIGTNAGVDNYGLAILSCQDVKVYGGSYVGNSHAVTISVTGAQIKTVVSRLIDVSYADLKGLSPTANFPADLHPGAELSGYSYCNITGGIILGSNKNYAKYNIINTPSNDGVSTIDTVLFKAGENNGLGFDIIGNTCYVNGLNDGGFGNQIFDLVTNAAGVTSYDFGDLVIKDNHIEINSTNSDIGGVYSFGEISMPQDYGISPNLTFSGNTIHNNCETRRILFVNGGARGFNKVTFDGNNCAGFGLSIDSCETLHFDKDGFSVGDFRNDLATFISLTGVSSVIDLPRFKCLSDGTTSFSSMIDVEIDPANTLTSACIIKLITIGNDLNYSGDTEYGIRFNGGGASINTTVASSNPLGNANVPDTFTLNLTNNGTTLATVEDKTQSAGIIQNHEVDIRVGASNNTDMAGHTLRFYK